MPTAEYDSRRDIPARERIMAKVVPDSGGWRILDVGAGTGWFARWAAARGHEVVAVDPDLDPIPGVEVVNERWEHDDIPDGFDLIVGLSILHHVDDWHNFIDRALWAAPLVIFEPPDRNENRPEVLNADRSPLIYDYLKARDFVEIGWSDSAFGGLRPVMVAGRKVASVTDGWGDSTRNFEQIGKRVAEDTGLDLVPGTLNAWSLSCEYLRDGLPLHAVTVWADTDPITYWETTLNNHPVIEVLMPRRSRAVREFMATVNLRETLGLVNGERIVTS